MKTLLYLTLALFLAAPVVAQPDANADQEAVRQAVLDYVEAIYNVEPERIERSVHPKLSKLGFYRSAKDQDYRPGEAMTFDQLIDVAKTWNKSGRHPKDSQKEIVIYEVTDQTATAKLTAVWGIDYLHLAKFDGTWKIVNVIWQSHPRKG